MVDCEHIQGDFFLKTLTQNVRFYINVVWFVDEGEILLLSDRENDSQHAVHIYRSYKGMKCIARMFCCSPILHSSDYNTLFSGGLRCHMSSGRAVWCISPLRSSDVCRWGSRCGPVRSPWSWSGREGQHYAQDWHCFWDLRWVCLEESTPLLKTLREMTKMARQTASNRHRLIASFLGQTPI